MPRPSGQALADRPHTAPLPAQGEWTYEDYLRLPNDGWRYEVLKGTLHMTPAPGPLHQDAVLNLGVLAANHLKSRPSPAGKIYLAPFDVFLPEGLAAPVQPDFVYLCEERRDRVTARGLEDAPDLVAEVLSPSNWFDDRRTKFEIYAQAGVREYWIVDPQERTVEVFVLESGTYSLLGKFAVGERVGSRVLPSFQPKVSEIFAS
ncbi:MAG TPA: Uma2 family endonuclease [Thermoanaerobaculia bacterium]|nr:Uma2 family endonuclease [Thermoanaerobaculia bacterium]